MKTKPKSEHFRKCINPIHVWEKEDSNPYITFTFIHLADALSDLQLRNFGAAEIRRCHRLRRL